MTTAIKILTKQEAVSAQGISDNAHKNAQSLVTAYQAVKQSEQMKKLNLSLVHMAKHLKRVKF